MSLPLNNECWNMPIPLIRSPATSAGNLEGKSPDDLDPLPEQLPLVFQKTIVNANDLEMLYGTKRADVVKVLPPQPEHKSPKHVEHAQKGHRVYGFDLNPP